MTILSTVKALMSSSARIDENFEYVTALLHGDGTNGAQNNTFVDSSGNNVTITRNGNTTQGTFSPYGNEWSNYFDGSGDYLSGASWSSAGNFGTADFTVECWVYATDAPQSNQVIWSCNIYPNSTGLILKYTGGGASQLFVSYDTADAITASGGWSFNQWHHVAVVRSSGTMTLYVDGTSRGSTTFTNNLTDGLQYIGRPSDTANYMMQGYISNFRIVKGTAVYTSTFTPPAAPLTAISGTSLLTCQSNRFIDNSSNAFAITVNGDTSVTPFSPFSPGGVYSSSSKGGSIYTDGTGDWLQAANVAALQLGSGNFTIEGWVYLMSLAAAPIFDQRASGPSGQSFVIYVNSSGALAFYSYSPGWDYTSNLVLKAKSWNHIAVVRNGNTATLYLNGVASSSTVNVSSYNNTSSANRIFNSFDPSYATGYLSDFRVTKSAVYTAGFTPPTAPLTAIANTTFLLSATNAGIIDNSGKNNLETVGNAQISTSVKKFGTGAISFPSTTDYLSAPDRPEINFGSGNFTVEAWVYITAYTNGQTIVSKGTNFSDSASWVFRVDKTTGYLAWVRPGFGGIGSTLQVPLNQWAHVALSRVGTTMYLALNGTVQSGTPSAAYQDEVGPMIIGWTTSVNTAGMAPPYVDDVRITKGVARYTSNFTPPAQAFPDR